jgi:sporulation protein YlmC with PRC-barrel domain
MKMKTVEAVALCATSVLCAQFSFAQQSDQPQNQAQQSGQMQMGSGGPSAASAQGDFRYSKLKGADLKSKNGESLGKIDDLIIEPRTGRIQFAILGSGGVLGIGEKRVPVPWQCVTIQSETQLSLNSDVDKQKLRSAPTVKGSYSDLNSPEFVAKVQQFFAVPGSAMGGAGEIPGGGSSGMGMSKTNSP